ncbi:unnamed protein product [Alopecurus aequalis]
MALRSLVGKLRIPGSLQRVAGSSRVASEDKMSSSALAKTTDATSCGFSDKMSSSALAKTTDPTSCGFPDKMSSSALAKTTDPTSCGFPDKMSSSALAKTTDPTGARAESYDEVLQSCFERVEKEARRQRRSIWKAVLGAEATVLAICFGGLCYWADNNRV